MRVLVLHQSVPAGAGPDEQDVLQQADEVAAALRRLDHCVTVLSCTLNLAHVDAAISAHRPDVVFNLVESLAGAGSLLHLPPALLEVRRIPCTGNSSAALFLTSHKLAAKRHMKAFALPTPEWVAADDSSTISAASPARAWMVKSVWEHASLGLDEASLVVATDREIADRLAVFQRPVGDCFAEAFVDGREFNVGLLADEDGPDVLPVAEIEFVDFPADKPRIVGYRAKWAPDSFEYRHTRRRFLAARDELAGELERLAKGCWQAFGLSGCARVDFRVDAAGKPWILEVNANPCLSPDAGFISMAAKAGLTMDDVVARLLADACARRPAGPPRSATSETGASRSKPNGSSANVAFRYEVLAEDVVRIRHLAHATGFFHDDEVEIAVELVDERLKKGAASGYEFVLAERNGKLIGYSCFGLIPCTSTSFDLYWIAVHPDEQGHGLGRAIVAETERRIRALGGTRVYAETSSRPQYRSTRSFYERSGYAMAELLEDFYAPGDGRATYLKIL